MANSKSPTMRRRARVFFLFHLAVVLGVWQVRRRGQGGGWRHLRETHQKILENNNNATYKIRIRSPRRQPLDVKQHTCYYSNSFVATTAQLINPMLFTCLYRPLPVDDDWWRWRATIDTCATNPMTFQIYTRSTHRKRLYIWCSGADIQSL
jgi:hypothetical protein